MSTRERYIRVIESLVNGEEAKASDLLTRQYQVAVTNVPFLTAIKYSDNLKEYIQEYY